MVAHQLMASWQSFERENARDLAALLEEEPGVALPPPPRTPESVPPYPGFDVIFERDLFAESRRPPDPEPAEPVVAVRQPPPLPIAPVLSGVTSIGAERQGILTVFEGNQNQGQTQVVKVGDRVQGYTVSAIADTELVLKWNDVEKVIPLGQGAPRQQAAAPRAARPVTVIRVGAAVQPVQATETGPPAEAERRGVEVSVAGAAQGAAARPASAGRTAASQQGLQQGLRQQQRPGGAGTLRQRPGSPVAQPVPPSPENPQF